jgi:predicted nucleotidyltransferase
MRLQPRDWHDNKMQLLEFAQAAAPYPCVFATLSGADLYGFPSDDSDYDIRASHVLPLRDVIVATLKGGSWDRMAGATIKAERKPPGLFADLVSHDIGKALRLALKGNGYVLEQISSPLVLITSAWHDELKDIAQKCIIRRLYYHYRGFFTGQEKLYHNVGTKRVKGLLYQYRVAMTGIIVLETGRLETNISRLNEYFRLTGVDELVARRWAARTPSWWTTRPTCARSRLFGPDWRRLMSAVRCPTRCRPKPGLLSRTFWFGVEWSWGKAGTRQTEERKETT